MLHIVLSDCKYQCTVYILEHISKGTDNMDHKKAFQRRYKNIQCYTLLLKSRFYPISHAIPFFSSQEPRIGEHAP